MQNILMQYLPSIILLIILIIVSIYLLKYNRSLEFEKRISRYSIEAINGSSFSLFDKLSDIYIDLRNKISKLLKRSEVLKKYSLKYTKYISYEEEKDISAMDYVTNKFFISLLFILLCLIADAIIPGMFGPFSITLAAIFGFFVMDIYFKIIK